ncbi:MAG: FG-GAP repeat protein [Planctomycetota bacterium]
MRFILAGAMLFAVAPVRGQSATTLYLNDTAVIPRALLGGSDLDADGVPDHLVALAGPTGRVLVVSGRTGAIVRRIDSGIADALGQAMAFVGDLDGDGTDDYVLGAPNDSSAGAGAGAVHVVSGRAHGLLHTFRGVAAGDGMGSCAALADIDGDGVRDFAIAAPGTDFPAVDSGAVALLSGRTLAVVRGHQGTFGQRTGEFMIAVADQDSDGTGDYAVSVRTATGHALLVFSGRSGASLGSVSLPFSTPITALVDAGDTDADGRPDVAVGSAGANSGFGAVVVLTGAGLTVSRTFSGTTSERIGEGVARAGDVDGDRREDLALVGLAPATAFVTIRVRSTSSGASLAVVHADYRNGSDLPLLATAGDVDGDGRPELLASQIDPNAGATTAAVLTTAARTLTAVRISSPVGAPLLQQMRIHTRTALAGYAYLLLSSASGTTPGLLFGSVRLPLNPDPLLFHALSFPNVTPYSASLGFLDAQGSATMGFGGFAPSPALLGLTLHHAALLATRGGSIVDATSAVALTFVSDLSARSVEEAFASNTRLDRARSGGSAFGTIALVGGSGLHGDFDYRLLDDLGNGVYEFDLQRDTRNGVRGFSVPANRTLSGQEEFVNDGRFEFATFAIPSGVTVRVVGSSPARWLVRGAVVIDGVLDVSGATQLQIPNAVVPRGQAGGRPGCGGGRGGDGADASDGVNPSNGGNGQDVQAPAGHAYAGAAFGTGGRGALQFPASNAALTHNYLTQCAQVPSGGGGGGMIGAGGIGLALRTPVTPPELGPPTAGGASFQLLPIPSPRPTFDHFLVGGAGGGGGGSHAYGHRAGMAIVWKIGAGGAGGGGALGLRAGHDVTCGSASALLARGGTHFDNYLHQVQGPPGPAGGGGGGTIVVQSASSVHVQDVDVGGGAGLWVRPGVVQPLNVETRGGDGAPGFYRIESPNTTITRANPPVAPDNLGTLLDRDLQSGQQSTWYATGTPLAARYVRFEIEATVNGLTTRFSDDRAFGVAPRFGDASSPLWFKLQAARIDAGGNLEPGSTGPWRDRAVDLGADLGNAFRFVIVRNGAPVQVTRVRVFVDA